MLLYNPRQFGLYLFILSQIARTETSFSGSSRLADTRMYSRMYLSWSQRYPVHGLYFTYVAVVEQDFFYMYVSFEANIMYLMNDDHIYYLIY
jgi:hypothetical protein